MTDPAPAPAPVAAAQDLASPDMGPRAGPRPPGQRRLLVLGAVAIVAVAVVFGAATILGGPGRRVETGVVVSVTATSLTAVQGFSIQTRDGRTVDFRIERLENAATFPPSHLAEHKVTLTPVLVTYVDRDGSHLAVAIDDAP